MYLDLSVLTPFGAQFDTDTGAAVARIRKVLGTLPATKPQRGSGACSLISHAKLLEGLEGQVIGMSNEIGLHFPQDSASAQPWLVEAVSLHRQAQTCRAVAAELLDYERNPLKADGDL